MRKLDLQLNLEIERGIYAAKEKFDNTVKGLDIAELQVHTYGKDYIKSKKLSPDAVMQLAFQVTRIAYFVILPDMNNRWNSWRFINKLVKVYKQARGPYKVNIRLLSWQYRSAAVKCVSKRPKGSYFKVRLRASLVNNTIITRLVLMIEK